MALSTGKQGTPSHKSSSGCQHRHQPIEIRRTIDLLAILQKSLERAIFYTFWYARFDCMALELRSQLYTFLWGGGGNITC